MNCHTFGFVSSLLRVLSTFTFYYLVCQMIGIGAILLYFGCERQTRGKVDTVQSELGENC